MKTYNFKSTSIIKYIIDITSKINPIFSINKIFNYNVWDSFLKKNQVILLLDGLDEIKEENIQSIFSYHLNDIKNIVKEYPKTIIASRSNHFDSIEHIKSFFTINSINDDDNSVNFNIAQLDILGSNEYTNFHIRDSENNSLSNLISQKITNNTIKNDIEELSHIPAFYNVLFDLFQNTELSGVEMIEKSLLKTIIEFNIHNLRSIEFINSVKEGEIDLIPFQAQDKFDFIKDFSWFLFERGYKSYFPLYKLSEYVKTMFNYDIYKLINDIKTQTVFTIRQDNDQLSFLTEGLYYFFVSRYIYDLLKNSESFNKGIEILGRYDFTYNNISLYLKEFIINNSKEKNKLQERIKELNIPIKSNYRFIDKNLLDLELKKSRTESGKFWYEINSIIEKSTYTNKDFLLIRPSKNIKPFFMKKTEVTNNEFKEFLIDDNTKLSNELLKRSAINLNNNEFKIAYNDYYLLYWQDDKMPEELEDHPVIYISWFAAAYFCNWLSEKDGFKPFYNFNDFFNSKIKEKNKKVMKNAGSDGYRLPTIDEWEYVAREGNYRIDYPWEKYTIDKNKLSTLGQEYKHKLLYNKVYSLPVMNDIPNELGIYGQIGNVREWVDKDFENDDDYIELNEEMPIKGATWLLGEEGFKFDNQVWIYAENTNFDVGFRIARSFTEKERNVLNKYKLL